MNDDNYICQIIIPSRNYERSKIFFEKVFGWKVQERPGTTSLDVLPHSGRGPSAELNSEEEAIVPSIYASDIKAKLKLIENSGGKILKDKTSMGKEAKYGYYATFEDPEGNKICLYSEK